MTSETLHGGFLDACRRNPERTALVEPDGTSASFAELDERARRIQGELVGRGVRPGDRVGLVLEKSIDAVASMLGILMAGAAYVPIDPQASGERTVRILTDCRVAALITADSLPEGFQPGATGVPVERRITLARTGAGVGTGGPGGSPSRPEPAPVEAESPAYVLYTSGSTGEPKGVVMSHRAACSFARWCVAMVGTGREDRVLSHAPLHFGLALQDLCMALWTGSTAVLVGPELGRDPRRLAGLVDELGITIWSSTSSVLVILDQHGHLERTDGGSLRLVFFAGEVLPIERLRSIQRRWTRPRYFNVCGATETNARLIFDAGPPLDPALADLPLGAPCAGYEARVAAEGAPGGPRVVGELEVRGPGLMSGYWDQPGLSARVMIPAPEGGTWFRTGDLVSEEGGLFRYHGRVDRMVKRRGQRVELGEIEAGLATHPSVGQCAVIAVPGPDRQPVLRAFVTIREGREAPSLIDFKRYCAGVLPAHLIPDRVTVLARMPMTATDKVDYQALSAGA